MQLLQDRFYTSTEVANILGVSLRSVYRYLDEGKIEAEVKTATGRHRFTKQNILDFLYPNGQNEKTTPSRSERQAANVENTAQPDVPFTSTDTPAQPVVEPEVTTTPEPLVEELSEEVDDTPTMEAMEEATLQEESDETAPVEEDEEVDWLAKFRAAAERHRKQMLEEEVPQEPKSQPVEHLSSLQDEPTVEPEVPEVPEVLEVPEVKDNVLFYKSSVGGLRELAQYISKTANKSSVPYAFTLNAGLSLHKLIRPFSTLHIYIRKDDKEFFEKALELSPTTEATAQLGVIIGSSSIFDNVREIHGLSVVADAQLKDDLLKHGETDLARELEEVIS